jgi:hypothetical protein
MKSAISNKFYYFLNPVLEVLLGKDVAKTITYAEVCARCRLEHTTTTGIWSHVHLGKTRVGPGFRPSMKKPEAKMSNPNPARPKRRALNRART